MKITTLILVLLLVSCSYNHKQNNSIWTIAYKSNKQGNTLIGSKQQLINAIRQGASIKIGWGGKGKNHSIEHLSVPIWIAVLDESEVIAHLAPQILSMTDWDNLSANYQDENSAKTQWRVVITTKGEFDAIWIDRNTHKINKRVPQNHTLTWFVKDRDISVNVKPLFSQ